MAKYSFWTCPNCGTKVSEFDSVCDYCKTPRYDPRGSDHSSNKNSQNTPAEHYTSSGSIDTLPAGTFKAYIVVLILLLVGTVLLCLFTPFGKRFIKNFNLRLVMDFSTTNFEKISKGLSWLGAIIVIGSAIYGAAEDSLVGGAIVGIIIYAVLCLVIVLIWNFVVPFIVNAVVYIAIIAVCLAFSFGSSVAIVNYVSKFITYLNPYPNTPGIYDDGKRRFYQDKSKRKEDFELKRSYFFGPGFFAVGHTILDTWKANFGIIKRFAEWLSYYGAWGWILGFIPFLFFALSIAFFGSAVTIVCSLLHIGIILPFMVLIFALFTVTWLIDRFFLLIRAIVAVCPDCQTRTVIPMFRCSNPDCGRIHTRLVPGPYGIWHRTCVCGTKLPTVFLLGRSKLKAVCPKCYWGINKAVEMASSDSMQFSISLVGGTSSGKTTMLSAYWHEFFARAEEQKEQYSYTLPKLCESDFYHLNNLFTGATTSHDTDIENNTAIPYKVLIAPVNMKKKVEYTLYDIRGEVFNNAELQRIRTQYQFTDSDGLVFVIDPLSSVKMKSSAAQEGDNVDKASTVDPEKVMVNFTTYLATELRKNSAGDRINRPVAVVITKADLPSVRRRISYMKIKYEMAQNPSYYQSFEEAKNDACRRFLREDIGFEHLVDTLEGKFSKVQYFPISAIGHDENGEAYEPEHIMEPFDWIMREANPKLAKEMQIPDTK